MSYLAMYRQFRPKTFDEVIGQKHVVQTLINQIESGKIGHAYLFCGSRGTGKTSTAKIFARAINCERPHHGSPCGECATCLALEQANNLDILEIDAASNNRVDEIRDLREKVKYPPVNGKYKVYIIDEVHMLTDSAFNALLKTLEEPPKYVVFILATTEVHKLPATILSRCMRFDFKLVSTDEIAKLIEKVLTQSGVTFEPSAVKLIARAAEGGVRDALSITDMCVSFAGGHITYDAVIDVLGATSREHLIRISREMLAGNVGTAMLALDEVLSQGKSPLVLSKDLIAYFRDLLMLITIGDKGKELLIADAEDMQAMLEQATPENYAKVVQAMEELSKIEQELRYSLQPRIVLECGVVRAIENTSLVARVEALEKQVKDIQSKNQ